MKTAVSDTSIEAFYRRIVTPGFERSQIEDVVAYVVEHPCCTRREIAEHFSRINSHHPLAQEARVAARVNAAMKRQINGEYLLVQSDEPVRDAKTGAEAYPLYPSNFARQMRLVA